MAPPAATLEIVQLRVIPVATIQVENTIVPMPVLPVTEPHLAVASIWLIIPRITKVHPPVFGLTVRTVMVVVVVLTRQHLKIGVEFVVSQIVEGLGTATVLELVLELLLIPAVR